MGKVRLGSLSQGNNDAVLLVRSDRSSNCRDSAKARDEPFAARVMSRQMLLTVGFWTKVLPAANNSSFLKLRLTLPGPAEGYKLTAEQEDGGENFTKSGKQPLASSGTP